MKLWHVCMKNFKVLFRSKTSAFTIIFGPLLIILLVGLAFNSQTHIQLNVGAYAPTYTELATSFIDAIKEQQITVVQTESTEACIEQIKQGQLHLCIIFPDNFVIANNKTNEVIFYADQSRTNFVYIITDIIGKKVDLKTAELSKGLTDVILDVMTDTKAKNEQTVLALIKQEAAEEKGKQDVDALKTKINSIDLTEENVNTESVRTTVNTLSSERSTLIQKGTSILDSGYALLTDIDDCPSCSNLSSSDFESDLNSLNTSIKAFQNTTTGRLSDINASLSNISETVGHLNERLANAKIANADLKKKADGIRVGFDSLKSDTEKIKATLEGITDAIDNISVTSSESIVRPISTRIEPVSTEGTNLNYLLPYLVVLIIMFISIMLSSTMVVMEKKSRAFFRNFITPTEDMTFIFAMFLTNLLLTLVQLIIIIGAAHLFLHIALPATLWPALLLVTITICLFTSIGMGLGYLLSTQEGVTLASLSIGSVLLLLSNIIIPLESLSPLMQKLAKYNIYVIASESLRKIMLFHLTPHDMYKEIGLLFSVALVIFVLIVFIQKVMKMQYLLRVHGGRIAHAELRLKNGHIIGTLTELLTEVKAMDETTCAHQKHNMDKWVRKGLHNKKLAALMKQTKTKTELIKLLEKETQPKL
ncbi:MAG: ABC transporter permease [archaeon]